MRLLSPPLLDLTLIVLLIAGFVISAALALVEVSLLRVRRTKVDLDAAEGDRAARDLALLLDDLPVVLNTVLFVVLLSQVTVAATSGYLAQRWAGGFWVTITSVGLSLLLFVYAEAIPKTQAVRSPYRWARRSARGLRILVTIFKPFVGRLVAFANWQMPATTSTADPVSEGELRLLARQSAASSEADTIAAADAELVERSFVFGDRTVADVMVPRTRIVAVSSQTTVNEALAMAIKTGHRRLPVLGNGIDDIVGAVRLRDLAAAARVDTNHVVEAVTMMVVRCRQDDPIAELMQQMRTSSVWLAIVEDTGGRTIGLATVEDVVAELMGEIEEDPVLRLKGGQ